MKNDNDLNDRDLNDRKSLMTLLHQKTQEKTKNTGKRAEKRGFDANSVKNTL